jgi:indole-3-glycerol phosphate synthase
MPRTYLDDIVAWHRARAEADQRDWRRREPSVMPPFSLEQSLRSHRADGIGVIAEVKRKSPSKGDLQMSVEPAELAVAYQAGGARGISVLTDEPHFGGSMQDLAVVAERVSLPILRKDFTVCENDVLDTLESGASAVLLIAAALSEAELSRLHDLAQSLGLDALIEVHDEDECRRALRLDPLLIGVNQRDLTTFEVDTDRAVRVAATIPGDVVAIAESGFSTVDAVSRVADAGFDAVLVGEAFVRSLDPKSAVASFSGHPVRSRA